jgi:hypothetical protein
MLFAFDFIRVSAFVGEVANMTKTFSTNLRFRNDLFTHQQHPVLIAANR